MSKLATKTIQFKVYRENDKKKMVYMANATSYKRPTFEMLSDEVSGAGIMGEIDMPSLGALGSLEGELVFNKPHEGVLGRFAPKAHKLEIRWATNRFDTSTGASSIQANKDIITMIPKALDLGEIATNETNESTLTFEIISIEHFIDGKSKLKIDKLNNVFKINGTDYTEKLKAAL